MHPFQRRLDVDRTRGEQGPRLGQAYAAAVPPLPMFALSLAFEGPARVADSLATAFTPSALPALLGLAYTIVIATVLGSGLWTWLMSRYPAGVVAPFSMLVPVVGMSAAYVGLHERLSAYDIVGGAVVVAGVLLGSVRHRRVRPGSTPTDRVESAH